MGPGKGETLQDMKMGQAADKPPNQTVKEPPGDASSKVGRLMFKEQSITDTNQSADEQMNDYSNNRRCTTEKSGQLREAGDNCHDRQEDQPPNQPGKYTPTDGSDRA